MMKTLITILGTVALLTFTGHAVAKTVIREEPLDWQQIANMNGAGVFQNLCASCHGVGANGNGPAASVIDKDVPDLTRLAANNGGEFSHNAVERLISGKSRNVTHGTIDMPAWEKQFKYAQTGWSTFQREAYARRRIHQLTEYIESIQIH
jgi:mono/diheme cytochrome c family protein